MSCFEKEKAESATELNSEEGWLHTFQLLCLVIALTDNLAKQLANQVHLWMELQRLLHSEELAKKMHTHMNRAVVVVGLVFGIRPVRR